MIWRQNSSCVQSLSTYLSAHITSFNRKKHLCKQAWLLLSTSFYRLEYRVLVRIKISAIQKTVDVYWFSSFTSRLINLSTLSHMPRKGTHFWWESYLSSQTPDLSHTCIPNTEAKREATGRPPQSEQRTFEWNVSLLKFLNAGSTIAPYCSSLSINTHI